MLVGAIVTYSEVLGKNTNSRFLPLFFNSLQPFLALLLIVVNLVFTCIGNYAYNRMFAASVQLTIAYTSAIPSWVPNTPLNASISENVYNSLSNYRHAVGVTMPKMRNIWISWLLTFSVPLAVSNLFLIYIYIYSEVNP